MLLLLPTCVNPINPCLLHLKCVKIVSDAVQTYKYVNALGKYKNLTNHWLQLHIVEGKNCYSKTSVYGDEHSVHFCPTSNSFKTMVR